MLGAIGVPYSASTARITAHGRSGCEKGFVVKGSRQMLADELQVGWHPDFSIRLAALRKPAGAADGRA
ncbi:ABC-three component system protein [Kineosporia mesophila]|uniref:ABC-three component system protein n=1 Tax=Kineosporia mesophila TaxID=566012 RepID=UPI0038B3A873